MGQAAEGLLGRLHFAGQKLYHFNPRGETGSVALAKAVRFDDGALSDIADHLGIVGHTTSVSPTKKVLSSTESTSPVNSTLTGAGGVFTYTLTITNTSVEVVEITALTDTNALSAECLALIGTFLDPGEVVSCTYTATFTDAGVYPNTAEVTVEDDEDNPASDSDGASVAITDVLPSIIATKTADDNSVPETGQTVAFTFTVTNTSIEPVTITELSDSRFGPLTGDADCQVGTVLPVGGSCEFTQMEFIEGDFPGSHLNTFTAKAEDNEKNEATGTDSEVVVFEDVLESLVTDSSLCTFDVSEDFPGSQFRLNFTMDPANPSK